MRVRRPVMVLSMVSCVILSEAKHLNLQKGGDFSLRSK
jgi:hypothetical protein